MSCLAHNKRFSSSFHSIINELRAEKSLPLDILRTMPRKCCTCYEPDDFAHEPSKMTDGEEQMSKLRQLTEKVNGKPDVNDKILLSLSRFKNLIHENRILPPVKHVQAKVPASKRQPSSMSVDRNDSSSSASSSASSSDEDDMDGSSPPIRRRRAPSPTSSSSSDEPPKSAGRKKGQTKRKQPAKPKKIKSGVFVYLPYQWKSKAEGKPDYLMDVAKKMQLSRFLGRSGHLANLEKQFSARLNLVTAKTSQSVTKALENAKTGMEKLTIHKAENSLALSEKQDGAWVLIRPKKNLKSEEIPHIDQLVEDLTNRWNTCLTIQKRVRSDSEDSAEEMPPSKKN